MRTVAVLGEHARTEPWTRELAEALDAKPIGWDDDPEASLSDDEYENAHDRVFPVWADPDSIERDGTVDVEEDPSKEENPSTSYPFADPESRIPARRIAAKVIDLCQRIDPELILNFHTTQSRSTTAYLHSSVSRRAIRMARFLKMPHIVFADIPNIGSRFADTITLDISESDPFFMSTKHWYRELKAISELTPSDYEELSTPDRAPKVWVHAGTLMMEDLIKRFDGKLTSEEARAYVVNQRYITGEPQPVSQNDPLLTLTDEEWREAWRNGQRHVMEARHLLAWSPHYMDQTGGIAEWVVPASTAVTDYVMGFTFKRPDIKPYALPSTLGMATDDKSD